MRLKTPVKLVNGKYQKISWDQALDEISKKILDIKKESGPDAIFWVGSSKHSNEQAYLLRKFVSFFGTNNCDHQARICHSTTVAGVANTWGYGAMTNSYNDMFSAAVAKLPPPAPPTDAQKAAAEEKKAKDTAAADAAKAQQTKAEDRAAANYFANMKAKGKTVTPPQTAPVAPAAPPAKAEPAKTPAGVKGASAPKK